MHSNSGDYAGDGKSLNLSEIVLDYLLLLIVMGLRRDCQPVLLKWTQPFLTVY